MPLKQSQVLGSCLPSLSSKVRHWVYASQAYQTKSGIGFMPPKPLKQSQALGLCLPSLSNKVRHWVHAYQASHTKSGIGFMPPQHLKQSQVLGLCLPSFSSKVRYCGHSYQDFRSGIGFIPPYFPGCVILDQTWWTHSKHINLFPFPEVLPYCSWNGHGDYKHSGSGFDTIIFSLS